MKEMRAENWPCYFSWLGRPRLGWPLAMAFDLLASPDPILILKFPNPNSNLPKEGKKTHEFQTCLPKKWQGNLWHWINLSPPRTSHVGPKEARSNCGGQCCQWPMGEPSQSNTQGWEGASFGIFVFPLFVSEARRHPPWSGPMPGQSLAGVWDNLICAELKFFYKKCNKVHSKSRGLATTKSENSIPETIIFSHFHSFSMKNLHVKGHFRT